MQDVRAIIAKYQEAMINMSADDLADLYAVDAVHELPFMFPGMPARYEGREAVRSAYLTQWAASTARPEAIADVTIYQTDDPEVAVVEQTVTGVVTTTGHPFRFPGILIFRLRNGEIVHVRDYMDGLAVAHAAGRKT